MICVLVWVMNLPRFSDPALGGWFQGAMYYFKIAVALAGGAWLWGCGAVEYGCGVALGCRPGCV